MKLYMIYYRELGQDTGDMKCIITNQQPTVITFEQVKEEPPSIIDVDPLDNSFKDSV